jgi:hypothetical protein
MKTSEFLEELQAIRRATKSLVGWLRREGYPTAPEAADLALARTIVANAKAGHDAWVDARARERGVTQAWLALWAQGVVDTDARLGRVRDQLGNMKHALSVFVINHLDELEG